MSEQPQKIKVAIVEDDKEMREGLESIVKFHPGLEFLSSYPSAEEALAKISDEIPDIVLMDIHLPGISGIECVRQLKPVVPHTQFMMCTVYEDYENIFDSLCAGATGYLLKNSPPGQIADKLFISFETVRTHIHNIFVKLHVQSRTEAVNKVFGR
ncbi:MAG: response regulator transcription factor [Bacteroidales bacterium]|nr:response regulator transcription factor [Bacteroidales bacterium]